MIHTDSIEAIYLEMVKTESYRFLYAFPYKLNLAASARPTMNSQKSINQALNQVS